MKISYSAQIQQINEKLASYLQTILVTEHSKDFLKFSNGTELVNTEVRKFKRRVFGGASEIWCSNSDRLLLGELSDLDIKRGQCRAGGLACQQLHGEKLKLLLQNKIPWNKGMSGNYPHTPAPMQQETKDKISKANSGQNNGMYGVKMSLEDKLKRSTLMKQKILAGEFTPKSNNRNTHWDCRFNGTPYRSSWEAVFQFLNPTAEYETLRLEYTFENTKHVYIVDFVDYVNLIVAEVKPRELCIGEKFNAKLAALTKWADQHKFKLIVADKDWLCTQLQTRVIDYSKFDPTTANKVRKLYETRNKNTD